MGIILYCYKSKFACGYSLWDNIKLNLILSTIDYIKEKIIQDYSKYNEEKLKKLKSIIEKINTLLIFDIIDIFKEILSSSCNKNTFIYFNLGGLYELCNKSNYEGNYTYENSINICKLFEMIKPYMKKYYGYEYIYGYDYQVKKEYIEYMRNNKKNNEINYECLYKIFKESVDKKIDIKIC